MANDEKGPLLASPSEAPEQRPLFQEKTNTKSFKIILLIFIAFVSLNLLIAVVLVSVMAALHNGLFALLLVSLLSFAQVEFFVLFFIMRGHLPKVHYWAVFVIGVFVVIESISTDIIVGTISQ